MSIPGAGNPLLLGGAAGGYEIERSLRFNSTDSAYLSRTPASAGNRKTWTWAGWVKKVSNGNTLHSFFAASSSGFYDGLTFGYNNSDTLALNFANSAGSGNDYGPVFETTQVFRDPSAWYHIVLAVDTTQATAADRVKVYVNGAQITTFIATNYPAQNYETNDFNTAQIHYLSAAGGLFAGRFFNGYLADIHFIDGQALTPSSFGETDANGIWQPKAYSGTYGTNGFQLKFADNSAATATTLGKDTSGNGNNWTPNNLSVTAGAGNDSLVDSPTNYGTDTGVGGEVRGNYCTLNPLITTSSTLANGNLDYTSTGTYQSALSTLGVRTGKWYFEGTLNALGGDATIGVAREPFNTATYVGGTATSWGYEGVLGKIYNNATYGAWSGDTFTAGAVIGVAFDADTGKLWFAKNGVWQASGNPATGANPGVTLTTGFDYLFGVAAGNSGSWSCNFGQRPFAYTAPSGFKALCTANLPTPTIANGATAMDVKLYTGNGSTQAISGLGFSPDLVWIKERNAAADHALYDIVRGTRARLESNTTDAEAISDSGLTAFNSDGFALSTLAQVNTNNDTYVAWTWDAGSSTVTNTQGSITSSVRANASAGFSVVSWTSPASSHTVGHGLGVAPSLIISKVRNTSSYWWVYHSSLGAANSLNLNLTDAATSTYNAWNNTSPSSTVFSVGFTTAYYWVAYCFAPVAGYSAFGSYTGNGSADGPFVYLGFRPAVVLVKMSSSTGNWTMLDYQREGYNVDNDPLYPNLANAEGTTDLIDITSNGFKVRTTDASFNTNAGTYIYAAWAQSPFSLARAR